MSNKSPDNQPLQWTGPGGQVFAGQVGPSPARPLNGVALSRRTIPPMVTIRPINADGAASFKAVRLEALRDTPLAFGSTFATESGFSDEQWQHRLTQWCGDWSVCYLAWNECRPCGIAAGLTNRESVKQIHLVSMWVAPTYRRLGVGRLLVGGVVQWALERHADTLYLSVTSANDAARRFYERLGFRKTGRTEPYPNDPSLVEFEMSRPVNWSAVQTAG